MRKFIYTLVVGLLLLLGQLVLQAQVTGSVLGTIVDQAGAVVPGAIVTVKGSSGQNYTATTDADGLFKVPGVAAGLYIVSVTAPNFKTSVVQNVKVDIGTPTTVNAALSAGISTSRSW